MSKRSKKLAPLFLSVICMAGSKCFANKEGNVYSPYMQLNGMRLFNVKEYNASIGVDTFLPLWQQNRTDLVFVDARLGDRSGSPFEVNLHFGYRRLLSSAQKIYGIYGSFDRKKTGLNNYFNQITLGAEHWNKNWFIGGNVYCPIGDSSKNISNSTYELRKNQYDVYNVWFIAPSKEKALAGLDTEVGYEFTKGLVGYVGGYYFNAKEADTVYGPRLRITYDWAFDSGNRVLGVFDKLGVEAGVQRDTPRGTTCYVSINARIGLSSVTNNVLEDVSRHMVDPVRRDVDIVSGTTRKTQQVIRGVNNEVIDIVSRDNNLYVKATTSEDDLTQLRNFGLDVLKMPPEKAVLMFNPEVKLEEKPASDTIATKIQGPLRGFSAPENAPELVLSQTQEVVQDNSAFANETPITDNKTNEQPEPVVTNTQETTKTPIIIKASELEKAPVQASTSIQEVMQGDNTNVSEDSVVNNKLSKQAEPTFIQPKEVLQGNNTSSALVLVQSEEVLQKPLVETKTSDADIAPVQILAPINEVIQSNNTNPTESLKIENKFSRPLHKEENIFIKKMQEIFDETAKQKAKADQEKITRLENRKKIEAARANVELFESMIGLAAGIDNIAVMTKANKKTSKYLDSASNDLDSSINTQTIDIQDSYKTLGVSSDATLKEVKQKYMRLIKSVHPDINGLGVDNSNHFKTAKYNVAYEDIRQVIGNKNNIEISTLVMPVLPLVADRPFSEQNFIVKANQIPVQQPLIKENFIIKIPQITPALPPIVKKLAPEQNFIVKACPTNLNQPAKTSFVAKNPNIAIGQLLAEQNIVRIFQENAAQSLIKKDAVINNSLIVIEKPLVEQKPDPVAAKSQEQSVLDQNPVVINMQEAIETQELLEQNFIVKSSKKNKAGVVENSDSDGDISTLRPGNLDSFMSEDSLSEYEAQISKQRNMNAELRELANRERDRQRAILSTYKEKYLSDVKLISENEAIKCQEIYAQGDSKRNGIIKVLETYLAPSFDFRYKRYKKEVKEVIGYSQEKSKIAVTNNDVFMLLIDRIPELNTKDPIADKLRFLLDKKADGLL